MALAHLHGWLGSVLVVLFLKLFFFIAIFLRDFFKDRTTEVEKDKEVIFNSPR